MKVTVKNKSGTYKYEKGTVVYSLEVQAELDPGEWEARVEFMKIDVGHKLELTPIEPECDHTWLLYAEYTKGTPAHRIWMNCPKCGNVLSGKEIEAIVTEALKGEEENG